MFKETLKSQVQYSCVRCVCFLRLSVHFLLFFPPPQFLSQLSTEGCAGMCLVLLKVSSCLKRSFLLATRACAAVGPLIF